MRNKNQESRRVRLAVPTLATLAMLAIAACSGGGDNSPDQPIAVGGVVQKGLFNFVGVNAYLIDDQSGAFDASEFVTAEVDGQQITVSAPAGTLVLLEASGEFAHELTGEPIATDEPMLSIVTVTGTANVNVNIATHLSAIRVLAQVDANPQPVAPLLSAANDFVAQAFGLPVPTDLAGLDFGDISATSDINDPNVLLLLLSAALVDSLNGDSLFADGFDIIANAFATANSLSDLQGVLNELSGFGAQSLYDAIRNAGFSGNLPAIDLPDTAVLVCTSNGGCAWVDQGAPTISIVDQVLYEAHGQAVVSIRLSAVSPTPVEVELALLDDTAAFGFDFGQLTSATVSIRADTLATKIYFPIMVDAATEGDEQFFVTLATEDPGYTVMQDQASVTILDGAPAGLEDQDATDLVIAEMCVNGISEAHRYVFDDCSVALAPNWPVLPDASASVRIDLAASCASSDDCPPQTHDWLVNFHLLAESGGAIQAERPVGSYVYANEYVQLQTESASPRVLLMSLGGGDNVNFINNAVANDWSLKIEARLDATPALLAESTLPTLIPVPAAIQAGNRLVAIEEVQSIVPGDGLNCPIGSYQITATFVVSNADPGPLAIFFELAGRVDGTVCITTTTASDGAVTGTLVQGDVDLGGTIISLPATLVAIPIDQGEAPDFFLPLPFVGVPAELDANGDPITRRSLLHAPGLPYYFQISGGSLTSTGIELDYDDMRYIMNVSYSPQDPRANGEIYSNDILYAGVAGQSGTLLLSETGHINATITVAPTQGRTAFPRGLIQSGQAFTQEIQNSVIIENVTTDLQYVMMQSTSCPSPDCDVGDDLAYGLSAPVAVMDPSGFVIAPGQEAPQVPVRPGWGADRNGNLAFSRPDDLLDPNGFLTLSLPGYVFPRGNNDRVVDYLLSHIGPGSTAVGHSVYPLGSAAANDGNFYPTGITVGPETYRDGQGLPDVGLGQNLFGNAFAISDGVDTANLSSSIASKYVVRNSGITGVFNVDPASLQTPLTFRGYSMTFERFAVRLIDNDLDTYNWIDGSTVLFGDAGGPTTGSGLELTFSNLEMNCSARFGGANLVLEQCDSIDNNGNGLVDENCGHRLENWRVDTEIYSMRFNDGQSCAAGSQLLALQQQVSFDAIDGPVGLDAVWTNAGILDSHSTQIANSYKLDRLADGSKGFPIKPRSLTLEIEDVTTANNGRNGRYGFAALPDVLIGVPFWNAINADVRLANWISLGQTVAEPTVVIDDFSSQAAAQDNYTIQNALIDNDSFDFDAEYRWGGTNFGFTLPVYYSPQAFNGEQPQFLGRRKSRDLFVLEAGAGINYIDPVRTKLSFGASADFEALGSLSFQIDLANPDTLDKVDDVLVGLNIVAAPVLGPALGGLNDKLSIVNNLANRGLDEAMQAGLELGLEELGNALPVDPFVTVSETLALIKSFPQQALVILDDEVKGRVDAALRDQRATIGFQLILLETELLQLNSSEVLPAEFLDALDRSILILDGIENAATEARDSLATTATEVEALMRQAEAPLNALNDALDDVDNLLVQAVSFSQAACSSGTLSNVDAAGYLGQITRRITSIKDIFDLLQNAGTLAPLADLLVTDPEFSERMDQIVEDVRVQAEEINSYLVSAETAVRSLVCDDRNIELLASAQGVIGDIRTQAGQISSFIDRATDTVASIAAIGDELDTIVIPHVQELRTVVADLRDRLGSIAPQDGATLLAELELQLTTLTGGRLNKLVADPAVAAERDILKAVFDVAQQQIDNLYAVIRSSLESEVLNLLPGAYYTPEQLRRSLVSSIMDSQPIVDLRTHMNTYLSEINYRLNNLILLVTDQLNTGIKAALSGVESGINDALSAATAPVRNIPLDSASLDGFAVIAGNELERAHIGAEWTMSPSADGEEGNTFGAALDAVSWSASNKAAGCGVGDDSGRLDVTISAMGLPARFLSSDIVIRKVYLGFTLGSAPGRVVPRGVFGGISTNGDIGFSEAIVYDPAFVAGIGDIETYIGASAGAVFSDLQAEVAFLIGRTCNADILKELDPRVGDFITLPPSGFGGAYLRGGATIPLLTFGCPLTVGVGADFGAWILAGPPATFGGLIGGSAYGKVACIGALRGQILAIGQVNTDGDLFFRGEGFGAAGAGFCEPETWTTKQRSRDDGMCGTGDASMDATFDNGKWKIPKPKISAIH